MKIKINIFILVAFVLLVIPIATATLSCTITNTTNCGSGTFVLYVKNDTGGWANAHAQNVSVATYPYGICCSDNSGQTVSASCSANSGTFLKLYNTDNSHVEVFNQSNYNYSTCITVTNRNVSCTYSSGSCAAGYSCIASVASSETSFNNLTNDHVDGNCTSTYNTDICCGYVNRAPTISSLVLNATSSGNYTTDNLTLYFSSSDADLDSVYNFTDWRLNGTSIAVLNMPFDANVSSLSAGAVIDYSTFGDNGQLGGGTSANAPTWTSNGKIGGAYNFNGSQQYISIPDSNNLEPPTTFTVSVWIYPFSNVTNQAGAVAATIVGKSGYSTGYRLTYSNTTAKVTFEVGNGSGASTSASVTSTIIIPLNTWTFIAGTFDLGTGVEKLYINGGLNATRTSVFNYTPSNANTVRTGYDNGAGNTASFNGSIDEIKIYNRTLTADQIYQEYLAGLNNKSTNIMLSNETVIGDNWSVLVGSCDGQACTTSLSNNVTIKTPQPSTVTQVSPTNVNTTLVSRRPAFIWNSDSLATWYEINITSNNCAGIFSNNTNTGSSTSNFTPSQDLCLQTEGGSNTYYNWTVRACNIYACGNWSTLWNLTIQPYLAITIANGSMSFGTLSPGNVLNTSNLSIAPFTFQNDGNMYSNLTNVTINQSLWSTAGAGLGTRYLQIAAGNTSEIGSFNTSASITNWTNATSNNLNMITSLNYNDANDSAYIHVQIEVPGGELAGNKTTYFTFVWQ